MEYFIQSESQLRSCLEAELNKYLIGASRFNELVKNKQNVPDGLVRHVAETARNIALLYHQPVNWRDGAPIVPFPIQIAGDLARNLALLAAGHIPDWMLHLQKIGAPKRDPRLEISIGVALAYEKLCKSGHINDHHPLKTICDKYGVSQRCVQKWRKEYPGDPDLFFPEAKSETERAKLIKLRFEEEATRYREWGRGPKNPRPFGKAQRRTKPKR